MEYDFSTCHFTVLGSVICCGIYKHNVAYNLMNPIQMPSPVPYKLLQTSKALCQQTKQHSLLKCRLCHYFVFDYPLNTGLWHTLAKPVGPWADSEVKRCKP